MNKPIAENGLYQLSENEIKYLVNQWLVNIQLYGTIYPDLGE